MNSKLPPNSPVLPPWQRALLQTQKSFLHIVKSQWRWLTVTQIVFFGLTSVTVTALTPLFFAISETKTEFLATVVSSLMDLTKLFVATLFLIPRIPTLLKNQRPPSFLELKRIYLRDLFAEQLAQLTRTLFGFILFIVPGILVTIRGMFINYIVLTHAPYQEGRISAYAFSKKLVKPYFWALTILLTVMSFGPPLIEALLLEITPAFLKWPLNPWEFCVTTLSFGLELYCMIWLFFVFEEIVQESNH